MKKFLPTAFMVMPFLGSLSIPCSIERIVKQRYVNYKNVSIYTEVYNYSSNIEEAIVFLPGAGGSHVHAQFLYEKDNPYRTITLDYLDHGKSGHIEFIDWQIQLDVIKAVVDSYGINQIHFVGHSFGADVAMMFTKKYPDKVKDIVLLDRAYYNFKDFEKYNLTKEVMTLLEHDPESEVSYDELFQYINMSWDIDITKTWDIKKDVLLLAGSWGNFSGDASKSRPSLAGIINMIKEEPSKFRIDADKVKALPDITEGDTINLVSFLRNKINNFYKENPRFSVIQTSYAHGDMVRNSEAMNAMRNYVIGYLQMNIKRAGDR